MKNVILILGILTTVMVFGVVAGVSTNASPPELDMDLSDDECRVCHVGKLVDKHHSSSFFKENDCLDCHEREDVKPKIEITCGVNGDCHYTTDSTDSTLSTELITDHHDFTEIFGDDYWDCLICHEKGEPRPLDK